jgi:hypothetical protein
MPYVITTELPYNLSHDQLDLEPLPNDQEPDAAEEFHWFLENVETRAAQERIFRSTAILMKVHPEAELRQCFHTAIIWECG